MVMTMHLYLIAGCRARVTDFSGNRDPNERFEDAIHRSPGNFWHSCLDVVKDLIGGRVIRTKGQGLQNHSPLNGEGQSVFATDPCEILQLGVGTISRGHNCNNIASDIKCQTSMFAGGSYSDNHSRRRVPGVRRRGRCAWFPGSTPAGRPG